MRVIRIITVLSIAIFIMGAATTSQVLGYKVPMLITIVGGQSSLNVIASWPDGYIQDRDTVMITKRGFTSVDTSAVNTLATNIRSRFPKVRIGVRTFGLEHMKNLRDADLSPEITILSYVYEDRKNWGDEPEFNSNFSATMVNYWILGWEMRPWTDAGGELWTEPTGRGLPHRNYAGWNYGTIAKAVDVVAIQSQHNAQEEWDGSDPHSYRDALQQVAYDMKGAGIDMWYMQISVGAEVNGIPGAPAYQDIFKPLQVPSETPGLHLWINPKSFLTDGRNFMNLWAPER